MPNYESRFQELVKRGRNVDVEYQELFPDTVDYEQYSAWSASSLNLLETVYGVDSTFTQRFREKIETKTAMATALIEGIGMLTAAAEEYKLGYLQSLRSAISDELVIDLCLHAEELISQGHSQSAAVLAGAALEDCFRKRAESLGATTDGKTLSEYIGILKRASLLSGATAKLVTGFPKFRNAAMHADWNKPIFRSWKIGSAPKALMR